MKILILAFVFIALQTVGFAAGNQIDKEIITTQFGRLAIYFIGHSSLRFEINGKNIYVDPWGKLADYSKMPKADYILITHDHFDHLDTAAISKIYKTITVIISNQASHDIIKKGTVMKNGNIQKYPFFTIEAVPAYNTTPGKEQYHPKGRDNGYIVSIGNTRIYIAGDTENTPEMEKLKDIDLAFLPMNQPYTMTPEQVADVVKKFIPKVLYLYHTGDTDTNLIWKFFEGTAQTEIRIKDMK